MALIHALALAAVWLSPAALLGAGALLVGDGTRGLWPSLVLGASALLAVVLLSEPWARLPSSVAPSLTGLVRHRWPDAGPAGSFLLVPTVGSTLLFLGAQLAIGRELMGQLGWAPAVLLGVLVGLAAVVAWRAEIAWTAAALATVAAGLGLAACLVAVMLATTPAWPRVFTEVASRPRPVFSAEGPWSRQGWPVRGAGSEIVIPVREEQQLVLLGRGRVRVQLWEGGGSSRDVRADTELTLRPGDRLVVPSGLRIRFQASRAIPGAPSSGPDWLDPPGLRPDWRALGGLALTLLIGGLGLAPVHAALPAGPAAGGRVVFLVPAAVGLGCVGVMLWSLYAVWLTPEIYIGGVAPLELVELPATVAALGALGAPLGVVAVGGLVAGGVAATLTALLAVPRALGRSAPSAPGRGGVLQVAVLAVAVALALAAPVDGWQLLVAAFGFAASAGAPAAVLAGWREGLSPRALALGAAVGCVVFAALSVAGLAATPRPEEPSWVAWLVAWPAVVAAPANALVVWLLSPPAVPSGRGALAADLATLHDET